MPRRGRSIIAVLRSCAVLVMGTALVYLVVVSTSGPGQGHAAHLEAVPIDATVPAAPTLSRTGWTATASSAETARENGAAANVLDGDAATSWHSQYSGVRPTLPAYITLDMHVTQRVSGLAYTPRPGTGGKANGRIGQYQISVSTNGSTWGTPVATGTWADDATAKSAAFAVVSTRYVRLTSLKEAGNRGPWASAGEINLLGAPAVVTPTPTPTPSVTPTPTPTPTITSTTGPTPTTGPALDRIAWTATASSAETANENGAPANVLDGNVATYWHSLWSTGTPTLPASITLDMHVTQPVSGFAYTPRPSTNGGVNGRIGQYDVSVSTDGTTWTSVATGTWPDDGTVKTAAFAVVSTRYVRLTSLKEAGNRGPWASAGEINLLGAPAAQPSADASKVGKWSSMIGFPLVPAAAAMLPNNRVLLWAAYSGTTFTGGPGGETQTAILDLNTNTVSQRLITNTGHDMFCPGVAILPDGRIMVTGGNDAAKTSIYDPASDTWSPGPNMNIARGYQGMTTMPDGEVFTIGGSWSGGQGGKIGEIWSATGGWRTLTNVPVTPIETADPQGEFRSDNHAWLFPVSGGRLLHAGPSKQMNWITTTGNGSITSAGTRGDSADAMNGNAVYYDVDKLVTMGGATAYQDVDATNRAYTIDVSGTAPVVTRVGDMASARAFANSVVLPDGKVLTVGGQTHPVPFSDATSILAPELWNPATGTFSTMAPMVIPRVYHSWALLLPDGRVISGGGGLCGDTCATNHPDAQIFTPPYLLNADGTLKARPVLTTAPTTAAAGTTISVSTDTAVTKFALVRYGEATHSVDNDQRRVPVAITASTGTTYQLALPADHGVLLPGPYLLFALTANGVPSVAKTVVIS